MDAVRKDVRRLVNKELEAANKRFPQFASPHEGQNVVREELEEAERAIVPLKLYIETRMWNMVKASPYLYYIGNPSLNCRPDEAARGLYTVDKLRDTQREERGEMRLPPAGKGSAEGKRGRRYSSLPG